ncbi:MAG TPA: diacylglycerol kinase family protein [Solirubrobacteraceae bacterium]|nr:diacylglycerol kinase family protein [Solirubrobacteraceae bacterium]
MAMQRLAAVAALVLAAATVVAAAVALIINFPRGLFVLLLAFVALAAGWHGVLHRGVVRVLGIAIAVVALAAVVVLLLSRDVVDTIVIVAAGVGAIAAARAAFTSHAQLDAVDPPKHPVLFYNPRSGGGKAARFHLADEAAKRGIEAVELTWETPLEALVDDALARGADALAAAGGDGTQAIVASAAARAGIPYACIPAGTRNHFALDLGVDREDVVGALDAFTTGGERLVDLAEVNGRVFVNNVSLGVYAQAVQQSGYRDAKLRTLLDTIPETARTDAEAPSLRWRDPDGFSHDTGMALLVSNNPYRLGTAIGSGTRPRLDTAQLGVAVLGPKGPGQGLMRRWSLPSIEVDGDGAVPAGIDGEAALLDPPLRFIMRPGALRVRISLDHPGASPSASVPDGALPGLRSLARLVVTGSH